MYFCLAAELSPFACPNDVRRPHRRGVRSFGCLSAAPNGQKNQATASKERPLTVRNHRRWGSFILALICAHFTLSYVGNHDSTFSLIDYADGKAAAPFRYRVLCAWAMRALMRPPHWNSLAAHSGFFVGRPDKLAVAVIVFPCILASVWLTRRTVTLLAGERTGLVAACLLLYMSYFSLCDNYVLAFLEPYDVPAMLAFCACLYALVADRMWLFYAVFVVGTLNRETTVFLIPLLFLWRRRLSWHALPLLAIWGAEKAWLHHYVAAAGAEIFDLKIGYNLKEMIKPQMWPALASPFGFLWALFLWRFRVIREQPIAVATAGLLALWVAGMVVVGQLNEVRIYTEMNALMAPCVAMILCTQEKPGKSEDGVSTATGGWICSDT